jgi:hypothetical protein
MRRHPALGEPTETAKGSYMSGRLLGAVAVVVPALWAVPDLAAAQSSETRKALLITGATSGISQSATEKPGRVEGR